MSDGTAGSDPNTGSQEKALPAKTGRVRRAVDYGAGKADALRVKAEKARPGHASIDAIFLADQHRRFTYFTLATSGLAFRLIFVIIPLALLGKVAGAALLSQHSIGVALKDLGFNGGMVAMAGTGTLSAGDTAALIIVGLCGLIGGIFMVSTSLKLSFSLAWRMPYPKLGLGIRLGGGVFAAFAAVLAWALFASWLRSKGIGEGVLGQVLWMAAFGGILLGGSWWLPHPPEATWRDLLPGAIFAAVGVEALHLITVLYLLRQIPMKMKFYGTVGVSFALLTWLWLLAMILVGSAALNAVLWYRRQTQSAVERAAGKE